MMEEVMEDFAQLMRRLLEIQSGGRAKSPEPIVEDERLIEHLQRRHLAVEPAQTLKLNQESLERARFKA
jgi:hypothetical protein